jgi:glutathione peroxidase
MFQIKCKDMKYYLTFLSFISLLFFVSSCGFKKVIARPVDSLAQTPESIYSFEMTSLGGETIDFNKYKGKKLLIVNTASECGFTPQYEDLQKLNELHGDKLVILGFPANNFGEQEPDSDLQIAAFCKENYAVTFQMFSKISVQGTDMAPLYQWLTDKTKNGWNEKAPNWNFCKYLVNENGELVRFYASAINPMSEEILKDIL